MLWSAWSTHRTLLVRATYHHRSNNANPNDYDSLGTRLSTICICKRGKKRIYNDITTVLSCDIKHAMYPGNQQHSVDGFPIDITLMLSSSLVTVIMSWICPHELQKVPCGPSGDIGNTLLISQIGVRQWARAHRNFCIDCCNKTKQRLTNAVNSNYNIAYVLVPII